MRFYTHSHPYYCGIDLHARMLYVCILDDKGETVTYKKINADPDELMKLVKPYIGNIVIGVECMHCWYYETDILANESEYRFSCEGLLYILQNMSCVRVSCQSSAKSTQKCRY